MLRTQKNSFLPTLGFAVSRNLSILAKQKTQFSAFVAFAKEQRFSILAFAKTQGDMSNSAR